MARYLVELPHTEGELLQVLNDDEERDLNKFEFGCRDGDHRGFAIVDVFNEMAAKNIVPASLRDKARVIEISRFTPDEIKSYHEPGEYEFMDYE